MSIESLILPKPEPTKIGPNLVLDCVLQEVHGRRSLVTSYPVEGGSNMNDHITNEPDELVVDGMITNSPVRILGNFFVKQVRGNVSNGRASGRGVNIVEIAFQELERIHLARELITITGRFKTYTDMAMVSAPITRTPEDGDSIRFTATFRKVRKVAVRNADIKTVLTKRESAQPIKKKGKQNVTPAGTAIEAKVSVAERGLRGLGF